MLELLIVVAIIAILAGLLLPALSKARDKARAIACSSQMKQVGTAVFMYANDNNDYLPTYNHHTVLPDFSSGWCAIPDFYLASYLGISKDLLQSWGIIRHKKVNNVMRCPTDTDYPIDGEYYTGSYAPILNSGVAVGLKTGSGWMECDGNGGQETAPGVTYHRIFKIRGASVLFIEMTRKTDGTLRSATPIYSAVNYDCIKLSIGDTAETRPLGYRHSYSANYCRTDGSVHSVGVGRKWKDDLSF